MIQCKKGKCNSCGTEIQLGFLVKNNGLCNSCKDKKEVRLEENKLEEIKYEETYNGLKLYTSSYLNHKMKKDLNSIKQEKICIKYKDKYILHEDIIKQFKDSIV